MDENLAGRWPRLLAQIIDGLLVLIPVAVVGGVSMATMGVDSGTGQPEVSFVSLVLSILLALYILALVVIQIMKLHKQGQTIGKQFAKVKIVKIADGSNGGVVTNFLMRVLIPAVIGAIPFIGPVFSLVDVLFIFRADKRCIHDMIAGTRVVVA